MNALRGPEAQSIVATTADFSTESEPDPAQPRWINRVRARLIAALPDGTPHQHVVARSLYTSTRSLRRRLSKEGTTYLRLLDDTRRELGMGYIGNSRLPVTEIALRLGFAETSSFSRAFRRWTGRAPSSFRARYPSA